MQLSDIRDEVQLIVQDEAFTDVIVDRYINDVYLSTVNECLVPEMKGMDTVATVLSRAYASMTGVEGGFSGVLSRVYNSSGTGITIKQNLEALIGLRGNLTDAGSVEAVALEGSTLWYYPIPAVAEVLTVIYYRNPELLVSDGDTPDALPEFVHRQILVNGAAAICFDEIEDALDTTKTNMRARATAKMAGVVKFREWLGKTRRHYVHSQELA
jgi:hypothetical protein